MLNTTETPSTLIIGGTGWIGTALVKALVAHGIPIRATVRTAQAAEVLRTQGATPVQVDVRDHKALEGAMDGVEQVIYAASPPAEVGQAALEHTVHRQGASGSLVYISGSSIYAGTDPSGRPAVETEAPHEDSPRWLAEQERTVLEGEGRGIVIRAAGVLWGHGGGATPLFLSSEARTRGASWYIDSGDQRWSALHVDDLAELVLHLLAQPDAHGIYNAAAEVVTLRDVAAKIAHDVGVRPVQVTRAAAETAWGGWYTLLSRHLVLDTSRALGSGWRPRNPSFLTPTRTQPQEV